MRLFITRVLVTHLALHTTTGTLLKPSNLIRCLYFVLPPFLPLSSPQITILNVLLCLLARKENHNNLPFTRLFKAQLIALAR